MPKGIPCLTEIQKQEIIKRVTDKGERVVDLAKEFKVDPKIIYNLLKTKANQHQAKLPLVKLHHDIFLLHIHRANNRLLLTKLRILICCEQIDSYYFIIFTVRIPFQLFN